MAALVQSGELLTTGLRIELEKTTQLFNRWASSVADSKASMEANYERQLEEADFTIEALKLNEKELENARTVNDLIKAQQRAELEQAAADYELLKKQKVQLETQLRRSEEDEERETQRLMAAREEQKVLRDRTEQKLNDLTHGLKLYKSLGLEFERDQEDYMKFVFRYIDPSDYQRPFAFVIFVDDKYKYQLIETVPMLDRGACMTLVEALNDDNNFGKFVFRMREMFCKAIGK